VVSAPLIRPVARRWDASDDFDVSPDHERAKSRTRKRGREGRPTAVGSGGIIVDISQLLQLPQATAAALMGVSESLLCKRFKEATWRKWPYREMQKLKATILQLKATMGRYGRTPELELDLAGDYVFFMRLLEGVQSLTPLLLGSCTIRVGRRRKNVSVHPLQ
jgi:hypothetical protein